MVAGGYGLARENGKVYLVKGAYTGEEVEIETEKTSKDLSICRVKRIVEPSVWRTIPVCRHFERCGGCDWMDLKYQKQLEEKVKIFVDQLSHTAKIEIDPPKIIGTTPLGYRNKVEFAAKNGRLGYFRTRSHDFVEIERCRVMPEDLNEVKIEVENAMKRDRRFAHDTDHVVIKHGDFGKMIVFISKKPLKPPKFDVGEVISLENRTRVVVAGRQKIHKGKGFLEISVGEVKYEVPAKSFFQVNFEGARAILGKVVEYAGKGEKLLDLYCGVGFFSLQLAGSFKKVVGVESSPASIGGAIRNSKINGIENVSFVVAKAQEWSENGRYDVVVADPPRTGLAPEVRRSIFRTKPERIVYVSCDVSTFARDLKDITSNGYRIKGVTLVDLFPQTHHFEIVSVFERNGSKEV